MHISSRFLSLCAVSAASVLLGLSLPSTAQAKGSNSSAGVEHRGSSCPNTTWVRGEHKPGRMDPDKCYPKSSSSPKIYRVSHDGEQCIAGYGREWQFCVEGYDPNWMANQEGNLDKANLTDRCPAGWVTAPPLPNGKGRCRPEVKQPATARLKGSGSCRDGEVEEWGIWCTSNFDHLKASRVKAAAAADWNDIYTGSGGRKPAQSPDDNGSEVYRALLAKEGGSAAPAESSGMAGAAGVEQTAAAPAEAPAESGCEAVGSAIGGAAGGGTGAMLGSMLGSLAKAANVGC